MLHVIFDDPESHEVVKMAVDSVGYRINQLMGECSSSG
jgi:hypothetical protein